MGDVYRSMPDNCTAIPKTRGLHSIRSKKMANIHAIEKRKYSCFFLACIDDVESLDECQNQTNKFVKPWRQQELTPFPPIENISDVEHDNEALVIDIDYDRVSDLVREVDVFVVIAPIDNPEKVHYYLLRCTRSKSMLMKEFKDPSNYTYAVGSMVLMGQLFE